MEAEVESKRSTVSCTFGWMNAGKYSWVACYYRQPYISFTRRASWSRFLLRWNWLTLDLPGHFCLLFQRKKLLKLDTTLLLLLLFLPPTCPPSQASRTAINPPQPLTPIYVCRVSLHSAELIKWQKTLHAATANHEPVHAPLFSTIDHTVSQFLCWLV